ncbi:hypothetical protein EVAR_28302_1 [Eumeta japonica]|uniref:Uncharacterized protein n=1 Tax=Eumeta variegata TaxID=151549 RepID=A0A4C1VAW1_EUMVA|nr:hypothetical protein EVAR_28302_1 [Eumeta japonica]
MYKLVVLFSTLAAAAAKPSVVAPLALAPYGWAAPVAYSVPLVAPHNYRGPLSLAPGQPASILAADGRPLDTLDVNLDRSAHITAKALEGVGLHVLKKRSLALPWAPAHVVAPAPLAYAAPLAVAHYLHAPYARLGLAHAAPVAHIL